MDYQESTELTDRDIKQLESIDNVDSVSFVQEVVARNMSIAGLDDNKTILSSLSGISNEQANKYTSQDFEYNSDEPAPIILDINSVLISDFEWDDRTTISQEFSFRPPSEDDEKTPGSTKKYEGEAEDLIGKNITLKIDTFSDIADYTTDYGPNNVEFKKISDSLIEEEEKERQETISKYWDYDVLSEPLEYELKIVDTSQSQDFMGSSYIPSEFGDKIAEDIYKRQLEARNSTEFEEGVLGIQFNGLTYNGDKIDSKNAYFGGYGPQFGQDQAVYNIPGLIINNSESTATEYTGDLPEMARYSAAVAINDVKNRKQVIKDLEKTGYQVFSLSYQDMFDQIKTFLNRIVWILSLIFSVIAGFVTLTSVSKYINDSRREIAVFRSLGAKRRDIRNLVYVQSLATLLLSIAVGAILGIITILILSGLFVKYSGFLLNEIGIIGSIDTEVSRLDFLGVDWLLFGGFILINIIITMLISNIPAWRAARISPVEAIKSE